MKTNKVGLAIFWIFAVYMIVMGWLASWWVAPAYRNLSPAQISETIWAQGGALSWLWVFSVPLGAILAGVGMLLYVKAKRPRIWLFGIGLFLIVFLIAFLPTSAHFPPLFGVGGGLILAFFLANRASASPLLAT